MAMADWSDLRYFLELSRSGTLAAAARKLRVDYTTVGRRLAALEEDLGAKLFERTPEGLILTEAGESIRAAAEEMEEAALLIEQRALGADRKLAGVVRVATTEMLGQAVVLPAVRALHEIHPQIRVDLATGAPRLDLARREADVALRYVRPESGDLISRRVARIAEAAYASKGYLASHPRPAQGDGLAGHDVVMLESRAFRGTRVAGEEPANARIVLRAGNSLALHRAVALGIGIGGLPCYIGDADRDLRRVFPDAPVEIDDLWLVVHADLTRTSRVRAVIDALEARLEAVAKDLIGDRSAARA
ncbi:MAG: LysR family transcriptional regulator [Deltaproteobacteria bacterium]|nr:MAG: LysR family transcriptional regulator [Deltaproteobacteria bacterium]TMB34468.1 MAG: LysR family transcriptional regulator [Deltaproteobacteria bacterium]